MPVKFVLKFKPGYDSEGRRIPVEPAVEEAKPGIIIPNNHIVTLDDIAAENGAYKTQEQWIGYWDGVKDGRLFASMKDMYAAFGQMRQSPEQYRMLLASLRDAFDKIWAVTSTRIRYRAGSTQAEIIHHYGSYRHNQNIHLEIPVYRRTKISDVLNSEGGLAYLKALFGTEQEKKDIADTLKFVSRKEKGEIFVWTPDLDGRANVPDRAALLYFDDDGFLVYGDYYIYMGSNGCSFGVRYASVRERE